MPVGAPVGVPISAQELALLCDMQVQSKSKKSDPVDVFSFSGFVPAFSFNRQDHTLAVVGDFGKGKVLETIDLDPDLLKAEWLDDQEIRDYAAIYTLRKGRLRLKATRPRYFINSVMRVDVVKHLGQTSLWLYKDADSNKQWSSLSRDGLAATLDLDSLIKTGMPTLPGGWVVQSDDLEQLFARVRRIAPFVDLPLSPLSPRWRKMAKAQDIPRTRPSLLTG